MGKIGIVYFYFLKHFGSHIGFLAMKLFKISLIESEIKTNILEFSIATELIGTI